MSRYPYPPPPRRKPPPASVAHAALGRAHAEGRVRFVTDARSHSHPGSPVWSGLDVFVPPVVLLTSSITLLLTFGLAEWIVAVTGVLIWLGFGAPRLVVHRMRRRAMRLALLGPEGLERLWRHGGFAIVLADHPEYHCAAPADDWRLFAADHLMEPAQTEPAQTEPAPQPAKQSA